MRGSKRKLQSIQEKPTESGRFEDTKYSKKAHRKRPLWRLR
jgi:hypothetical protein